jgi:hypothetical protein
MVIWSPVICVALAWTERTSGLQWLVGDPVKQLLNGEVNNKSNIDSKGWQPALSSPGRRLRSVWALKKPSFE